MYSLHLFLLSQAFLAQDASPLLSQVMTAAVAAEVAREWQQERVRERMEWLYAHDATAVVV